jgi:hypothetical protein
VLAAILAVVLEVKGEAADKMRSDYAGQKKKYEQQGKEIHETARNSDEVAEADEHRAFRYDVGEGLLEIGLVLSSLYFISKKRMFPVLGLVGGLARIVFAVSGLMA